MGKSFLNFAALVVLSLFAISCGKAPQVLKSIDIKTSTVDSDIMLNMSADLNLGNMSFPAVALPIIHPRLQRPIGKVELLPILGGKNQLKVSLNISELSDIRAQQASLPNGNLIPLIANNEVVVVELGAGARLYLTLSSKGSAIAVAIPIKSFDSIGSKAPGLNIFPMMAFGKVIASAGLFTSSSAGQNGIAVVADFSEVFKLPSSSAASLIADEDVKLDHSSQDVRPSAKSKVDSMLLQMHNKKVKLQLHK
ncbi:MAG TPA: hypothetical protein VNJ01_07815 [Bacteriovoracaceae bacterium]|nr:hypothetical protein [Bacteriovoracaceae bacterium]